MSAENDDDSFPRSMRHRQVLDVAAEHPDASVDEIASMVPSATADLVDHVFEEHGDPAADDETPTQSAPPDGTQSTESEDVDTDEPTDSEPTDRKDASAGGSKDGGHVDSEDGARPGSPGDGATDTEPEAPDAAISLDELSETQRELLEVVARRPDATQAEIADHFGVTRATVSRWASEIEGFDWRDRAAVVDRAFETAPTAISTDGGSAAAAASERTDNGTVTADESSLDSRLERLESRVGELETPTGDSPDVELTHKIAHACLQSDAITEDEELRILEWLLE
jgi:hypothetical protein